MTNAFLIPAFICSFIQLFIYLKANICRAVPCQAAPLQWWSGRGTCNTQVQVSHYWQKHQKSREIGSFFTSLGLLNYERAFVWRSSLNKAFLWNFVCSAFLMPQKKVDHIISPYLQQSGFLFVCQFGSFLVN